MTAVATAQAWLPTSIPWIPCFQDIGPQFNVTWQCANLTVPVDYLTSSHNKTTQIGLAKASPYELTTPVGGLFLNFGGPGGSTINPAAKYLDRFLETTERKFELFFVDPRGTGWSKYLTCGFTSEEFARYDKATDKHLEAIIAKGSPVTKESLTRIGEVMTNIVAPYCATSEDLHYLAHINTPNVARDFDLMRNLTGYDTLDLWGFSYGTVVGAMYASIFPDCVGRIVLDGVVDFARWTRDNPLDMEFDGHTEIPRILDTWASYCIEAARIDPQYCEFARPSLNASDPTVHLIERFDSITRNLTQRSFVDQNYDDVVYTLLELSLYVRASLMRPNWYHHLARYLSSVENTILHHLAKSNSSNQRSSKLLRRESQGRNTTFPAITANVSDPLLGRSNVFLGLGVDCLDLNYNGLDSLDTWVDHIHEQVQANPLIGYLNIWTAQCLKWPNLTDYGAERFEGLAPAKLRNKMLLVGVTSDPATPYHWALETYKYFGADNADLLVHDATGHCSPANNNTCTISALKAYFVNGTLPANGTVCVSNNTGERNMFVKEWIALHADDEKPSELSPSSQKLRLGMVIAVTILVLSLGLFLFCRSLLARLSKTKTRNSPSWGPGKTPPMSISHERK